MTTTHHLAVAVAVIVSSIFAGCQKHAATNPEQNIFYKVTHQAETFGYTDETFQQLQVAYNQSKPLDFRQAFYYYNYGCGYYHTNKVKR